MGCEQTTEEAEGGESEDVEAKHRDKGGVDRSAS
jgi:hypothetical protein